MAVNPYPTINVASLPENITIAQSPLPRPRAVELQLNPSIEYVSLDTGGSSTVRWSIKGTWVGEIFFEASLDGIDWFTPIVTPFNPVSVTVASSTTTNGQWVSSSAAFLFYRWRGTLTSGLATISIVASMGASGIVPTITTPTLTLPIRATGTITNTESVTLAIDGAGTVRLQVLGTWTGTLEYEASSDNGVTFIPMNAVVVPFSFPVATFISSTTVNGRFVSVGTYYILVESEEGEKGWGKAIAVRGRN